MQEIIDQLNANYQACDWSMHPKYCVFTNPDSEFYESYHDGFVTKYRWMWTVARTLKPASILELGVDRGGSADAYISASGCSYVGIDLFRPGKMQDARALFDIRGFDRFLLVREDLRNLRTLPYADLIVVDGAHDYENQKADIELALTGRPKWIYIDDARGKETAKAIDDVMAQLNPPEWTHWIDYVCEGGLIWKMPYGH